MIIAILVLVAIAVGFAVYHHAQLAHIKTTVETIANKTPGTGAGVSVPGSNNARPIENK